MIGSKISANVRRLPDAIFRMYSISENRFVPARPSIKILFLETNRVKWQINRNNIPIQPILEKSFLHPLDTFYLPL
jgi:hypothetical protein